MAKPVQKNIAGSPKHDRAFANFIFGVWQYPFGLAKHRNPAPAFFFTALMFGLVSACTQTGQQPNANSISSVSEPTVKITNTAVGHANLQLTVDGAAKDLFKQRDCVLGKFARENGATHILTPKQTEVTFVSIDGRRKSSLDHPFEYFVSGQQIPDGAESHERLLARCGS